MPLPAPRSSLNTLTTSVSCSACSLLLEAAAAPCHQHGILLGHLIELDDGGIDLGDAIGLLGSRGGHFGNDLPHLHHIGHDLFHGGTGLAHHSTTLLRAGLGTVGQL